MKVLITKLIRFFKLISLAFRLSKRSRIRERESMVSKTIKETEVHGEEE